MKKIEPIDSTGFKIRVGDEVESAVEHDRILGVVQNFKRSGYCDVTWEDGTDSQEHPGDLRVCD